MNKSFLVCLLIIAIQANLLNHLQTSYQTCCPDTYVLEPTELRCICPPTAPLLSANNRCISCSAPQFWNATSRLCSSCPANSWYV